ncbi:ER membrane protein complex subunit [Paramyrothecium foliicola]|nr:ER membrane protein complex subunit [Paramyrothecium foliicola]
MLSMQLLATLLLGLLGQALAAELTLYLPAKPNPFGLAPSTHATLSSLHHHASAPLSGANTFVFRNVSAGSYLVDVHCPSAWYQPLRVDVGPDGAVEAWETFRGNDWGNKGERLAVKEGSAGKGVDLRTVGPKNYYAERPKFSILSILKNPMILMGLGSMVLVFGMPKLVENMDPEMRAEFEARQKEGPISGLMGGGGGQQAQSPLGNFDMAAYLAGSDKQDGGSGSKKR